MATIGSLVVDFKSNTGKFNAGIRAANNNMRSFERQSKRTGRVAAKAFSKARKNALGMAKSITPIGGLLAGGVVAGFIAATKAALGSADAIAKTADAAGLSTDALQGLRFQASQTGVGTEALDKAMTKYIKTVGETKAGTGTLITILKKQDNALLQNILKTRDQAEALRLVADAIKNESDESRAAALANAAFGRQGARLVKTFKSGARGIDEFLKRAKEANLVIGEKLLRSAETANDRIDQLARTIKKSLTVALVNLAPQITEVADQLIKSLPRIIELIRRAGEVTGLIDQTPARVADLAVRRVEKQIAAQRAFIDKLRTQQDFGPNQKAIIALRQKQIEKLKEELSIKQQILAVQQALAPKLPTSPTTKSTTKPTTTKSGPSKAELSSFSTFLATQQKFAQSIANQLRPKLDEARAMFEALRTPSEAYRVELERIAALQARGFFAGNGGAQTAARGRIQALLDMASATGDVVTAMRELRSLQGLDPKQFKDAAAAIRDMDPAIMRVAQRNDEIARSLANAVGSARSLGDAFRNVGSVIGQIVRQLLIIEPLTKALRGILNGGSGGGGGLFGKIFGAAKLGTQIAGARAAGGPVARGKTFLVGENGPELFTPDFNGNIIANDRLRKSGRAGGTSIAISIDASGAVSESAVRSIVNEGLLSAAPEIVKAVEGRSFERARALGRR
ncbi:MAG: hypothetical protein COB49_01970 [Alphaproteobacteria bacterium]|nr:MAG: hypothetical protein COB49_01970 [Alphaproteobacteria bacterium]